MIKKWPNIISNITILMRVFPPVKRGLTKKVLGNIFILPKIRMFINMNTSNSPLKKTLVKSNSPSMSNCVMIITEDNWYSSNSINSVRVE